MLPEKGFLFREYPEFFSVEDYDLWLRLSKKHKFYFISEVLGEYLLHQRNISSKIERHYINQIKMIKRNFREYKQKKILDFCLINFRIARIYFVMFRHFIRKRHPREALKYFFKTLLQPFAYV